MSKNVIFCWSGTGNCLTMAKIIAGELGDTDIIMARKKPARLDVTDAERVGFVFPCHGGGAPVDFLSARSTVWTTGRPCIISAPASGCSRTGS